MQLLLLPPAPPGERYLVDLGKLIPVPAISPLDAFQLASLAVGNDWPDFPPHVYRLDAAGYVIEEYSR